MCCLVHRAESPQYLQFFITYKFSLKAHRRLHGNQPYQLHHMVLHDVSHHSGLFIKFPPVLYAQIFGHGYLYVVHIAAVPEVFKYGVRKTEKEDVLDRLFAEIMVDTEYLIFIKGIR